LNDKFEIKGTPITDFNLYIYDRWGKQIWSTHNWENQWDGTDASGNIVPVGTYIYKIAGTSPDPDANYELGAVTYQGTVTVTK
jgi:gliding motility-associated-like protein